MIGIHLMRATRTHDFVIRLQAEENKHGVSLPVLLLFPLPLDYHNPLFFGQSYILSYHHHHHHHHHHAWRRQLHRLLG